MVPGLPATVIGRNPFLAWGGTNLHAASSELFDVSQLPPTAIRERRVRVAVRWGRPHEFAVRETDCGPVVSDLPFFPARPGEALALRWVGHERSDELTALLAINRAHDAASFRAAAEGIAVPGQTLVYAGIDGRVERISAARLPRRIPVPPRDLASPPTAAADWAGFATSAALPDERDPPRGFVVSANERPPIGDVPIGWLFSAGERATRLAALIEAGAPVGFDVLAAAQRDVAMMSSLRLRDRLRAVLDPPPRDCPVFAAFSAWDGRYEPGSPGALAFELVVARLVEALVPPPARAMFGPVRHGTTLLAEHCDSVPAGRCGAALRAALAEARSDFRRLRDWGGVNRLRLAHPLARLPWIGWRHPRIDWPWPGSNETLMKAAHAPVTGRHAIGFGSNARYLFNLSDPDANRLVILGGQDGVPGSPAFLDQAELFRRGDYIEVPLRPETARARHPHRTVLQP
jgi:penicillin amidase